MTFVPRIPIQNHNCEAEGHRYKFNNKFETGGDRLRTVGYGAVLVSWAYENRNYWVAAGREDQLISDIDWSASRGA